MTLNYIQPTRSVIGLTGWIAIWVLWGHDNDKGSGHQGMKWENVPQDIQHRFIIELMKGNFEKALLEEAPWSEKVHSQSVADVL